MSFDLEMQQRIQDAHKTLNTYSYKSMPGCHHSKLLSSQKLAFSFCTNTEHELGTSPRSLFVDRYCVILVLTTCRASSICEAGDRTDGAVSQLKTPANTLKRVKLYQSLIYKLISIKYLALSTKCFGSLIATVLV